MKIKAKLYKANGGNLTFVDKGVGDLYEPDIRWDDRSKHLMGSHVTLSLGYYRIHLDKEDFIKFAKHVLFNKER